MAGAPAWDKPSSESRDRPPRGRAPRGAATARTATKQTAAPVTFELSIPQLREKVLDQFAKLGVMLSAVEPYDAKVLLDGAERWTDSLLDIAKSKPWLRKRIEQAVTGGIYLEFVFATACIAIPIGKHHNVIPEAIPDPNMILGKFAANFASVDATENSSNE